MIEQYHSLILCGIGCLNFLGHKTVENGNYDVGMRKMNLETVEHEKP
jgi:hypothetical protein